MCADGLNYGFLLLLSATPVQNDLIELYNLLTLLKPGIFRTLKEFRSAYMTPGKPRQPANAELTAAARRLAASGDAKRDRLALRHLLVAAGSSSKAAAVAVARLAA